VALNVAVSEQDRAALKRLAPSARVAVVSNGVDLEEFRVEPGRDRGVAFVGGLHWIPNLDALRYFCAEILPRLRELRPDVPVRWLGSASPEQQLQFRSQFGVDVSGYLDDVRPLMQASACHIVPLRAGGGTRLKILNSWAMGKPVVSTSIGCEGLAVSNGENIRIEDDPKAFAEAIVALLDDEPLRRRLGQGGRATVERLYSWDIVGAGLIDAYLAIANARTRHVASPVASVDSAPRFSAL
jgi:glycosyltransferase involved in cell wall biosynthesis